VAELIRKGAEASIYLGEWLGEKAVFKVREPKRYRQPVLDAKIRGHRVLHEASFIAEARRLGVATPLVYFIDRGRAEMVIQFIPGPRLKEVIDAGGREVDRLCKEAGRYIAKLHKGGIIHGDLTTSNFIVTDGGRLALIDFGLSFYSDKLEDKAVDIHLLNMVAKSAHSRQADRIMREVLRGYVEVSSVDEVEKLLARIRDVEKRGRYKQVE